jgi:hypothetical protein
MTSADRAVIRHRDRVDQRGRREFHIGDDESPWIPLVKDVAWIRHLAFDVRSGSVAHILKVGPGGLLERHRHRGAVHGYTLRGSWRYREYDWLAETGSWVQEFPGAIHTLVSEAGMETVFWMSGTQELLDAEDRVVETLDVYWYIDNYLTHCEANGVTVNERLFV